MSATFAPVVSPATADAVTAALVTAGAPGLPVTQTGPLVWVHVTAAGLVIEGEPVTAADVRFALTEAGFVLDPAGDDVVTVLAAQATVAASGMVTGQTRVMWRGTPQLVTGVQRAGARSAVVSLADGSSVRCQYGEPFVLAVAQ